MCGLGEVVLMSSLICKCSINRALSETLQVGTCRRHLRDVKYLREGRFANILKLIFLSTLVLCRAY